MFDIHVLVLNMSIILRFFQCAVDECGAGRSIIRAASTGQCGVRESQETVHPYSPQWQVLHLLRRRGDRENIVSSKSCSLSYMYMYPEENDIKVLWDKMNILTKNCIVLWFIVHHYREKKFRLKNQTQYPLKLKLEVRDDSHVFKVRDF